MNRVESSHVLIDDTYSAGDTIKMMVITQPDNRKRLALKKTPK